MIAHNQHIHVFLLTLLSGQR